VVVNGVEITRDWPWEKVREVKEKLKRLRFRWDGVRWIGRVNTTSEARALANLLELTNEEFRKVLGSTAADESTGTLLIEGELPEELRECVVERGVEWAIVSLGRCLRNFLAKGWVPGITSFDEMVEAGVKEVAKVLRKANVVGDVEKALNSAREFVSSSRSLRRLFERRLEWRTAELHLDHAVVKFLSRGNAERLRSLALDYNVVDREGNVVVKKIKLVRIVKLGENAIKIEYPVFLRDTVSRMLSEMGYVVRVVEEKPPEVQTGDPPKLYEFQENALNAWMSRGMRGTIVVPTGGGKTYIGLAAIAKARVPTIVLVTTEELARQWAERIRKHLGVSPGMLGGGVHDVRSITVAIYNSAVKYVDDIRDGFWLAIFDECHHVPAETFKEVALRLRAPYRLALSATPSREDGNEHLIFESAGPIVYRATYSEMIESGLVVPVRHYRIYVRLNDDELKQYKELEAQSNNVIVLRNLASKAQAKIPVALAIVKRELMRNSKIIVFTQFIEQAEAFSKALAECGIKSELVTSKTSDRDKAFARFSKGISNVIVTTTVLDEGVDVPDADVAVVLSGTGSKRQMIQRVGRVVRASPGKREARVYEIVARNTIEEVLSNSRHFDDEVEEVECRRLHAEELKRLSSDILDFLIKGG